MKTHLILFAALLMVGSVSAQFQHAIGTPEYEVGRSVNPTFFEKGFIVGGQTKLPVFGAGEATLIKTKPDGSIVWSAVYGNAKPDIFNSVREVPVTSSPNLQPGYAALGTTQSFGLGADDMYFVRTNLSGAPLFSRTFGRAKNDRGHCLQFIKDNLGYGYVMVGETNSYTFFGGTTDVYVVKTDEFGNLVRETVIGGVGNEIGYWIEQTRDLGYIIVGTTTSSTCGSSTANQDIFVIRLNSNLNILWNAIIGGGTSTNTDIGYGVVENPVDGSFTITGITRSYGVNLNGDAFLLNLKSNGLFNWMKTYGRTKAEVGNSIHLTRNPASGLVEYVVGGYSTSFNATGVQDAYVFKTDANGNLLWTSIYGKTGREVVAEITDSGEQGYVFAGEVSDTWTTADDVYLVKTDINGKTGTCDLLVGQTVKVNSVCYTSSAQQVFVTDILNVQSLYKRMDYGVKRCNSIIIGAREEEEDPSIKLSVNSINNLIVSHENNGLQKGKSGTVNIYSTRGELVAQEEFNKEVVEVPINALPPGLYIVHIRKANGTVIRRKLMKE